MHSLILPSYDKVANVDCMTSFVDVTSGSEVIGGSVV